MRHFATGLASTEQKSDVMKKFYEYIDKLTAEEAQFFMGSKGGVDYRFPSLQSFFKFSTGHSGRYNPSELGYPEEFKVFPIVRQVKMLASEYKVSAKGALACIQLGLPPLPEYMEDWGAYVLLAADKHKSYAEKIGRAAAWMNTRAGNGENREYVATGSSHAGIDYAEGHYEPTHLVPYTQACMKRRYFEMTFVKTFGGTIIIAPMQWGKLRAGQTDNMVEAYCYDQQEFPLTAFDGCNQVALHPSRIGGENLLGCNFPGDRISRKGIEKGANPFHPKQRISLYSRRTGGIPFIQSNQDSFSRPELGPMTASCWNVRD